MARKNPRTTSVASAKLFQQAVQLYQSGDLAAAATFCRKVLDLSAENAEALHLLGVMALDQEGAATALPWLQRATQSDLSDPYSRIDLARALNALKRPAEAEHVLHEAHKIAPRLPVVAYTLGTILETQGKLPEAEQQFRRGIELEPRFAESWIGLGNTQSRRDLLAEAEVSYRKALAIDPRQRLAHSNLANVVRLQGRTTEAEQIYRMLLAADPNDALTQHNLGLLLYEDERPDQAVPCFQAAMAADPAFIEAHFNFASLRADQGHGTEALALFERIVQSDPDYQEARHCLGLGLLQEDRIDEALNCFRAFIAHAPDCALAHSGAGFAYLRLGRMEDAEAAFRSAADRDPAKLAHAINLADVLLLRQKSHEATAIVAQALNDHAPTEVHRGLAQRHFARARFDAARQHYETLQALDNDDDAAMEAAKIRLAQRQLDADAWAGYARFLNKARSQADAALPRPLPEDLTGRTIVIKGEQGIGDELFFLRFIAPLAKRGARVLYRPIAKTAALLNAQTLNGFELIQPGAPLPSADQQLWITALPYLLAAGGRSAAQTFPGPLPLKAQAARRERIARVLEHLGPPPYIGVTWRAGIGRYKLKQLMKGVTFLAKKVPVQTLGRALEGMDATFLVLQRSPEPGEIERFSAALGVPAHDLTALNDDLDDMLALLDLLDDYVGVSNTNMHLMAGLGKTARVLVPCPPEWRWMESGDESPWFERFRIYRESPTGNWDAALAALTSDLEGQRGGARRSIPASESMRSPAVRDDGAHPSPNSDESVGTPSVAITQRMTNAWSSAPAAAKEQPAPSPGAATAPGAAPARISDAYRRMQEELHRNPNYGVASVEFAPTVANLIQAHRIREILDYGAGKGRLGQELVKLVPTPLSIHHYEPAVAHWSATPAPRELVASIDVLEHIEPELLDNVLDDLKRVVLRFGLFTIATGPAGKVLPDGRNAHLIQEPASWWLPKLMARFELAHFSRIPRGFLVVVERKA